MSSEPRYNWEHKKTTPGHTELVYCCDDDGYLVATCDPGHSSRFNAAANADMIAAAPDLLAACYNLVSVVEQLIPEPSVRGVADVVLSQAWAAIAKAKGQS